MGRRMRPVARRSPGVSRAWVAIALAWLLIACSSSPAAPTSRPKPPDTTPAAPTGSPLASQPRAGCGTSPAVPLEKGNVQFLTVGGVERRYRLGLPASYTGLLPAPVVLNLHGADDSGSNLASVSGFERPAWARGYIVVHPDAVDGLWNFEDGSDLMFMAALLDSLAHELCVDPARLYLAGLSQGGDMASFVACHEPGRLAAFASVAVLNAYERCPTWAPTPVIAFAGTADPIYRPNSGLVDSVPFSGDPLDKPGSLPAEAGAWALANGCAPDAVASLAADVTTFTYDCPDDADVEVLLHNGGHTWPGGQIDPPAELGPAVPDLDASALILDFFDRHPAR